MLTFYLARLQDHHRPLDQVRASGRRSRSPSSPSRSSRRRSTSPSWCSRRCSASSRTARATGASCSTGPFFGIVAVVVTWATTNIPLIVGTRLLEGAATAASIPSILGFIAVATAMDEGLRGKIVARFEAATLAGLLAGFAAAGPLFAVFGPTAFLLNALVYGVSLAIYRYGSTATSRRRWRRRTPRDQPDRLLALPADPRPDARLAARPDVDRHQRGPGAVHHPDDLPARPRARPALRRPAADGRLRARAGQPRARHRRAAVLRRPPVLGQQVQEPPPDDDHPVRDRAAGRCWSWPRSAINHSATLGDLVRSGSCCRPCSGCSSWPARRRRRSACWRT